MTDSSADVLDWSRWHALVEEYTPDGWLGRLLLGAISGSASVSSLFLALFGFATFSLFSVLGALLALAGGLAAGFIAVVTLWPVYLSLIGNVSSAAEYDPPGAPSRADAPFRRDSSLGSGPSADEFDDEDPVALLKHRYAAGELSDDEFERRLDRLLGADERMRSEAGSDRSERDPITEPER